MRRYTRHLCLTILIICLYACKNKKDQNVEIPSAYVDPFIGQYADSNYESRDAGWDWVGVIVSKGNDSAYHIAIRSRADKKKPTCFFDAEARQINDSTLKAVVNGTAVLFQINDSTLRIQPEKAEDANALYYYCSGGASIAGNYLKQKNMLAPTQIDKRIYAKFLSLQNISFEVSTALQDSGVSLTVFPYGLTIDTSRFQVQLIDSYVINAEIEDMNADGYPELVIYTRTKTAEKKGDVIGLSVNKGKSLSMISMPAIMEDALASKGYQGKDEFSIVENTLQRLCLVKGNDGLSKRRFINYKMKKGEAGYIWEITGMRDE